MIGSSSCLDDIDFDAEKKALERSASEASRRRRIADASRGRRDHHSAISTTTQTRNEPVEDRVPSLWTLLRTVYPTIPGKPLLALGLALCVLNGAMTPVFSFLLARLIVAVSNGGVLGTAAGVNVAGATVLAVAALDGLLLGAKHGVMENAALRWVQALRKTAFGRVVVQDQKWFDRAGNGGAGVVQVVVRDGDEAGALVAVVLGQLSVVGAMLGVGMVWALVEGWQLALVGFAIAPVFAGAMAIQAGVVERCEVRVKRATEEVARRYYEVSCPCFFGFCWVLMVLQTLTNIRGIRFMALETIFRERFDGAAERAHSAGMRGAFVEGCTHGMANALIYVAEAMLFYVGAVLVARGTYTYLQMVQVLNLVVFTVTIGSQMLSCSACLRFYFRIFFSDDDCGLCSAKNGESEAGDVGFVSAGEIVDADGRVERIEESAWDGRGDVQECDVCVSGAAGCAGPQGVFAANRRRGVRCDRGFLRVGQVDDGRVDSAVVRAGYGEYHVGRCGSADDECAGVEGACGCCVAAGGFV